MDNNYGHISRKLLSKRQSLMLHALGFVTGDPSIRIDYPYVFHPGLQVQVSEPGDSKWIYMMLPVTRGSLITDIKIAYHRTGLQSRITLIRLVEQREPVSATVVHNEIIEKTTPVTDVINTVCRVVVNDSILLKVCLDFANTDDMIELGMVEISYIPNYTSFSVLKKKGIKTGYQKEDSITGLFSNSPSLNLRRPSLTELFLQKKEKRKSVFKL
ncbi:hypothetical protein [uncultured Proteiniphilum sp.]|uniref:hypothetical protein n=1 Tax=uncultured Proteiniphilum sp. TaxID=497637 RepID=UPI0026163B8D|nr:hypothetical protein [uncultured Proteiniphilum sp.]